MEPRWASVATRAMINHKVREGFPAIKLLEPRKASQNKIVRLSHIFYSLDIHFDKLWASYASMIILITQKHFLLAHSQETLKSKWGSNNAYHNAQALRTRSSLAMGALGFRIDTWISPYSQFWISEHETIFVIWVFGGTSTFLELRVRYKDMLQMITYLV